MSHEGERTLMHNMIHEFSTKIYHFNKILIFASERWAAGRKGKPAAASGFFLIIYSASE